MLIDDMLETMLDADGIGLAAPQVYAPLRIVVAMELADRAERDQARLHVLVNPELELEGDADETAFEGCLSLPGLRGRVPRHRSLRYRGLDRTGAAVSGPAPAARGGGPASDSRGYAPSRSPGEPLHIPP